MGAQRRFVIRFTLGDDNVWSSCEDGESFFGLGELEFAELDDAAFRLRQFLSQPLVFRFGFLIVIFSDSNKNFINIIRRCPRSSSHSSLFPCSPRYGRFPGTTVEIVQNEVNNRATPTLISFTQRQRLEGDQAQALIKSNLKNTVRYFKHLLAAKFSSARTETEKFWSLAPIVEDTEAGDGSCAYEVDYLGERKRFSVLEIFSGFFRKVRQIANNWCDYHGGRETGSETSRKIMSSWGIL